MSASGLQLLPSTNLRSFDWCIIGRASKRCGVEQRDAFRRQLGRRAEIVAMGARRRKMCQTATVLAFEVEKWIYYDLLGRLRQVECVVPMWRKAR